MDAELLGPHGGKALVGLEELGLGHAVLGVAGVVHHLEALPGLAQGEDAAGIVAAADLFGDLADGLFQIVHHSQIVQVDDSAQTLGLLILNGRGVVGGEHDVLAGDAAALTHEKFRLGRAVAAAALFVEDLQNGGGGGGLHGKILPVAGVPGKGGLQRAGVFPDALLVIDMEGGGILGGNGLQLGLGSKGCFHAKRPQILKNKCGIFPTK